MRDMKDNSTAGSQSVVSATQISDTYDILAARGRVGMDTRSAATLEGGALCI